MGATLSTSSLKRDLVRCSEKEYKDVMETK